MGSKKKVRLSREQLTDLVTIVVRKGFCYEAIEWFKGISGKENVSPVDIITVLLEHINMLTDPPQTDVDDAAAYNLAAFLWAGTEAEISRACERQKADVLKTVDEQHRKTVSDIKAISANN